MSITPVILVILTFIVNFIMDFSFWSVMLSLYYIGGAPAGTDDGTLLVKLTLASVLIPAVLARLGIMERFFVYSEGGRKAYGEDGRLLKEGLENICRRGNLIPSDYRLYVGLRNEYNAFSLGKSIVVMAPLLRQFPEEELLGIMAHEMGHIQRGHTGASLLCVGMSWFGQIIVLVYNTIFLICRLLVWIPFLGLLINLMALSSASSTISCPSSSRRLCSSFPVSEAGRRNMKPTPTPAVWGWDGAWPWGSATLNPFTAAGMQASLKAC